MKRIGAVLALACALLAAGCGSLSTKYPIGTTAGLVPDVVLVGTWKGHFIEKEPAKPAFSEFYLHFLYNKDGPMIAIWVAPRITDEGDGAAALFRITTALLGQHRYINAAEITVGSEKRHFGAGTMPLLYKFDDSGQLLLFGLNTATAVKAIKDGTLAGTVTHHGGKDSFVQYDDVEITSEPAQLDAFMARPEAADLFAPWIVLKKAD